MKLTNKINHGNYDVNYNETDLLQLSKNGDEDSLNILMGEYDSFIYKKASSFNIQGLETEDLIQEGKIGFISAIRNYDENKGASFRTYAYLCITNRMTDAVRSALRKNNSPLNGYISLDDANSAKKTEFAMVVNPEDMIVSHENILAINSFIKNSFTPIEQKVFFLYLSGISYSSMAKKLNVGAKFIDNALQRMKRKLNIKIAI